MSNKTKIGNSWPSIWMFVCRFSPLMKPQKHLVCGSFAAMFAEVLFRLLEPWPLKFIIDHIIVPSKSGGVLSAQWQNINPTTLVTMAAIGVIVFAFGRAIFAYFSTVGFAIVGNRVLIDVRSQLYDHLQTLSLRFHSDARRGDLITRIIGDVSMLKEVAVTAFLPLFGNIVVLLAMMSVMLWMNWRLTVAVLAVVPLVLISTRQKQKRIRAVAREQRKRESALAATAAESISAIKTVQALSLGENFRKQFSITGDQDFRAGVKGKRLAAALERSVDVVLALATALVLWIGTLDVLIGRLTPGEMLVFLAYLKGAFKPVRNWAKFSARIAKAGAAAERVVEILDTQPEIHDAPHAKPLVHAYGDITFDNLRFAYNEESIVLNNLSLHVKRGQHLVVMGPSGAGKSSLLSLLLRLHEPSNGRILIDEHDLRDLTVLSWRTHAAVVLQDTTLFTGSIADNICQGVQHEVSQNEIEHAARIANIHQHICALPQAYCTTVGEGGVTLSTGQRQRIAIARAAIRNAPILILDEPLAALDADNVSQVRQALQRLSTNRTTIHVTHDLRSAEQADHILYLKECGDYEHGTHSQLLAAAGSYASVYRRHAHLEKAHVVSV